MAIKLSGSTIIDDNRKVINAANVGIGTTNPSAELHLQSASEAKIVINGTLNRENYIKCVGEDGLEISADNSNSGDNSILSLNVDGYPSVFCRSYNTFITDPDDSAPIRVGINTDSMARTLTVVGNGNTGGAVITNNHTVKEVSGNIAGTQYPHVLSLRNDEGSSETGLVSIGFDITTPLRTSNCAIAGISTAEGYGNLGFYVENDNDVVERVRLTSTGIAVGLSTNSNAFVEINEPTLETGGRILELKSKDSDSISNLDNVVSIASSSLNTLDDTYNLINDTNFPKSFLSIYNPSNAIENGEVGIHFRVRQSGATGWTLYAKRTGTFDGRLIVRSRVDGGTTSAEHATILSDGRVGIGITDPSIGLLRVKGVSNYSIVSNGGNVIGWCNNAQSPIGGIYVSDFDNTMRFITNSATERIRITDDGIKIQAGFGISFAGSTGILDDYEEGTFDMTVSCGGNTDTQTCRYTKIGNMVYIEGHGTDTVNNYFNTGSQTAGTSVTITSSLPFVPSRTGGAMINARRTLQGDNSLQYEPMWIGWRAGSSTIYLSSESNNYYPTDNVTTSSGQTNKTLLFSGHYRTAS